MNPMRAPILPKIPTNFLVTPFTFPPAIPLMTPNTVPAKIPMRVKMRNIERLSRKNAILKK